MLLTIGCTDGALRLVAGSSEREGMVEVCADQTWRAVAHTAGWGMEEAEVVCRQLSLQTTGYSYDILYNYCYVNKSTHNCSNN